MLVPWIPWELTHKKYIEYYSHTRPALVDCFQKKKTWGFWGIGVRFFNNLKACILGCPFNQLQLEDPHPQLWARDTPRNRTRPVCHGGALCLKWFVCCLCSRWNFWGVLHTFKELQQVWFHLFDFFSLEPRLCNFTVPFFCQIKASLWYELPSTNLNGNLPK